MNNYMFFNDIQMELDLCYLIDFTEYMYMLKKY